MSYRLLVVAGENPALHDLKHHLRDDVLIAQVTSANEALWEVRNTPPHAIVADLDLADMSGLDMAEILPNFGVSTRMVLVSRAENQQARQQAVEFGVYRFLDGALSSDSLLGEVYEALRQGLIDEQEAAAAEPEPEPELVAPPPTRVRPALEETPGVERVVRPLTAEERAAIAEVERNRVARPASTNDQAAQPAPRPTASQPPRSTRRIGQDLGKPYEPPERTPRRGASEGAGGLAARARQQAQAMPPAAPTPPVPPAEPAAPRVRDSGTLVVTANNLASVNRILSDLSQVLGAQCALLTDRAGMPYAQHGSAENLSMMVLLPLLSTSFSTSGELARQLREEDATTLYIHDGTRYGLYCFDILQRYLMVVVFDKNIAATKIGSVWVEGRGAIRKLREALS